jgi:hypothetical protein
MRWRTFVKSDFARALSRHDTLVISRTEWKKPKIRRSFTIPGNDCGIFVREDAVVPRGGNQRAKPLSASFRDRVSSGDPIKYL